MKSVKIPWYQKPILHNNKYINVQRGAMLAALFSFVNLFQKIFINQLSKHEHTLTFRWIILQFLSLFTIATAVFDLYCLSMAAPGSTHYGYYFISYEFVYVGNRHGIFRNYEVNDTILWTSFHSLTYFVIILVRNILVMFALFSFLAGLVVFVTSVMLTVALRKVSYFFNWWNLFCIV